VCQEEGYNIAIMSKTYSTNKIDQKDLTPQPSTNNRENKQIYQNVHQNSPKQLAYQQIQ